MEGLDWTYTYSTDGETNTDEMPQFKDAGTYTVHVKATNPNYEDLYATVTVEISPREVTLTSATDSKTYDGTALTNHNVSVGGDGFVEGEGATYDVTGSQTNVVTSYKVMRGDVDVTGNYDNITTADGTLTVTPRCGHRHR